MCEATSKRIEHQNDVLPLHSRSIDGKMKQIIHFGIHQTKQLREVSE